MTSRRRHRKASSTSVAILWFTHSLLQLANSIMTAAKHDISRVCAQKCNIHFACDTCSVCKDVLSDAICDDGHRFVPSRFKRRDLVRNGAGLLGVYRTHSTAVELYASGAVHLQLLHNKHQLIPLVYPSSKVCLPALTSLRGIRDHILQCCVAREADEEERGVLACCVMSRPWVASPRRDEWKPRAEAKAV